MYILLNTFPKQDEGYWYKLAVGNKHEIIGGRDVGLVSYCVLLSCVGPKDEDCGERLAMPPQLKGTVFQYVRLTVKFTKNDNLLVMPSTLDTSLMPMDVDVYTFTGSEELLVNE